MCWMLKNGKAEILSWSSSSKITPALLDMYTRYFSKGVNFDILQLLGQGQRYLALPKH